MAISFLTGGSIDGQITVETLTSDPLLNLYNTSNGSGSTIRFSDQTTQSQVGDMTFRHSDGSSQGGGASWHFVSEPDTVLVVGNSTVTGRFVAKSAGSTGEVDYGFYDDVNTGMYRTSADNVSLVAGGVIGVGVGSTAVTIKYAGSTKLATVSGGVDITGNGNFSGDITVSGGDITLGGTGRIQGVDTVSANTDAANKLYVDNAIAGVPQGDITGVTAGTGMTGGGSSGTVTLNVIGGDGITANADDIEITPAQTTISSIYYDGLDIGGVSGVNDIQFSASKIAFRANSVGIGNIYSGGFRPATNNTMALGTTTAKWSSVFATTFSGDLNGTINTATTGVTQSQGNNSTKIATTAYVDSYNSGVQTISEGTGIKVTNGSSATATVSVNYDSTDTDNLIFGANTVSAAVATKPYTPYILAADSNPGVSLGEVKNIRLQSIPLDRFGDATTTIDMGGNRILDVADPTAAQDAATKAYVDANSGSGTVTGTGSNTRVAFWSGSSSLTSDADLTYATATNRLSSGNYIIPNNGDYLGTDTSGAARTLISLTSGNDVEISNTALSSGSDTIIFFGDTFRVKDGANSRFQISSNGTVSTLGNTFNSGPINIEQDNKITFDYGDDEFVYVQATNDQMEMGVGGNGLVLQNIEESLYGQITVDSLRNMVDGQITTANATYIPVYTDSSSSTTPRPQRQQTPSKFLENAGAVLGAPGTSGRVAVWTGSGYTNTIGNDTLYWNTSTNVLGINYSGSTFTNGALQIQGPIANSNSIGLQIYNSTSGSPYGAHGIFVNGPRYGNAGISVKNPDVGTTFMRFYRSNGSTVGTITQNGTSSTSYNTTSDYRLKENIVPMTGSIDRLKGLKPSKFNFIDQDVSRGATPTVDGFIAHEVSDIIPEAITGEKDGLDFEGNPEYQSIDQSKIVPLLTGALQEAISKIESLEARIKALES
jgi:hypothetical protein